MSKISAAPSNSRAFPNADHLRVNAKTLGQLSGGLFVLQSGQRYFGFELWRAVLFSLFAHCQILSFRIDSELNTLSSFWGPPPVSTSKLPIMLFPALRDLKNWMYYRFHKFYQIFQESRDKTLDWCMNRSAKTNEANQPKNLKKIFFSSHHSISAFSALPASLFSGHHYSI